MIAEMTGPADVNRDTSPLDPRRACDATCRYIREWGPG